MLYDVEIRQIDFYSYRVKAKDEGSAQSKAIEMHSKAYDRWELDCIDWDMEVDVSEAE